MPLWQCYIEQGDTVHMFVRPYVCLSIPLAKLLESPAGPQGTPAMLRGHNQGLKGLSPGIESFHLGLRGHQLDLRCPKLDLTSQASFFTVSPPSEP